MDSRSPCYSKAGGRRLEFASQQLIDTIKYQIQSFKQGFDSPLLTNASSIGEIAYVNDRYLYPYAKAGRDASQAALARAVAEAEAAMHLDMAQQEVSRNLNAFQALGAAAGAVFQKQLLGIEQLHANVFGDPIDASRVAAEIAETNRLTENLNIGSPTAGAWGWFGAQASEAVVSVMTGGTFGATTLGGRVVTGALIGGASQVLQPVDAPAADYWMVKRQQVGTGAILGATVAGSAPYVFKATGMAWRGGKRAIAEFANSPSVGGWRAQIGAIGDVAKLKFPTPGANSVSGALRELQLSNLAMEASGPRASLQTVVDRAVSDLTANPGLARDLMSPGSYQHLVNGTKLAGASWGKAVERLTARYVRADGSLSSVLSYQSRPFAATPDFFGYEGYNLHLLDITTEASIPTHMLRPYGPITEYVIHPGLPQGLVFPQ